MKIDSRQINEILMALKDEYPQQVDISNLSLSDSVNAQAAMFYLAEKELICINCNEGQEILSAKITCEGIDYLEGNSLLRRLFSVSKVPIIQLVINLISVFMK